MGLRKLDAFVTNEPFAIGDITVPKNAPLLCVEVYGGVSPWVIAHGIPLSEAVLLPSTSVRKLTPVPLSSAEVIPLYEKYVIESSGKTALVDRPYREGEIVVADDRIQIADGARIPRGHKLMCKLPGETHDTFVFTHPLEYVEEEIRIPREMGRLLLAPCDEHDAEQALERNYGMRFEVETAFYEGDEMDAWIARLQVPGGHTLRIVKRPDAEPAVEGHEDAIAIAASLLRLHAEPGRYQRCDEGRPAEMPQDNSEAIQAYVAYRMSWHARAVNFHMYVTNQTSASWRNKLLHQRQEQSNT